VVPFQAPHKAVEGISAVGMVFAKLLEILKALLGLWRRFVQLFACGDDISEQEKHVELVEHDASMQHVQKDGGHTSDVERPTQRKATSWPTEIIDALGMITANFMDTRNRNPSEQILPDADPKAMLQFLRIRGTIYSDVPVLAMQFTAYLTGHTIVDVAKRWLIPRLWELEKGYGASEEICHVASVYLQHCGRFSAVLHEGFHLWGFNLGVEKVMYPNGEEKNMVWSVYCNDRPLTAECIDPPHKALILKVLRFVQRDCGMEYVDSIRLYKGSRYLDNCCGLNVARDIAVLHQQLALGASVAECGFEYRTEAEHVEGLRMCVANAPRAYEELKALYNEVTGNGAAPTSLDGTTASGVRPDAAMACRSPA
jgi:hypothetical protein